VITANQTPERIKCITLEHDLLRVHLLTLVDPSGIYVNRLGKICDKRDRVMNSEGGRNTYSLRL